MPFVYRLTLTLSYQHTIESLFHRCKPSKQSIGKGAKGADSPEPVSLWSVFQGGESACSCTLPQQDYAKHPNIPQSQWQQPQGGDQRKCLGKHYFIY